jgi:hypothetical protein
MQVDEGFFPDITSLVQWAVHNLSSGHSSIPELNSVVCFKPKWHLITESTPSHCLPYFPRRFPDRNRLSRRAAAKPHRKSHRSACFKDSKEDVVDLSEIASSTEPCRGWLQVGRLGNSFRLGRFCSITREILCRIRSIPLWRSSYVYVVSCGLRSTLQRTLFRHVRSRESRPHVRRAWPRPAGCATLIMRRWPHQEPEDEAAQTKNDKMPYSSRQSKSEARVGCPGTSLRKNSK